MPAKGNSVYGLPLFLKNRLKEQYENIQKYISILLDKPALVRLLVRCNR